VLLGSEQAGEEAAAEAVAARVERLLRALRRFPGPVIVVSNEVGAGIVPGSRLGRWFRDAAGRANQRLAAAADTVFLVTAGLPVTLKGRDPVTPGEPSAGPAAGRDSADASPGYRAGNTPEGGESE
jgi:hypothetical protein